MDLRGVLKKQTNLINHLFRGYLFVKSLLATWRRSRKQRQQRRRRNGGTTDGRAVQPISETGKTHVHDSPLAGSMLYEDWWSWPPSSDDRPTIGADRFNAVEGDDQRRTCDARSKANPNYL